MLSFGSTRLGGGRIAETGDENYIAAMCSSAVGRPPIEVLYSGLIQQTFGLTRDFLTVQASGTVRNLLLAIAELHGDGLREALFVGDGLVPNAVVLLDGRDIRQGQGPETPIGMAARLELLLLPPATGGG